MSHLVFCVPPGLGDISWCYEKLVDVTRRHNVSFRICGDEPRRSFDFVNLLPCVQNLGYGPSYGITRKRLVPYHTDLMSLPNGNYNLSLNPHLEAGGRIETAYPLQKPHFHYDMNIPAENRTNAIDILKNAGNKVRLGFYCSSHKHRPLQSFWDEHQWVDFLTQVYAAVPNAQFIALGAHYDDKTINVYRMLVAKGIPVIAAIGNSPVGQTIEIIRRLDYFFAFPSGLAILADVVKTPCMMWYWSNTLPQFKGFPNSYADPESVRNKRHMNLPYNTPADSFHTFQQHGLSWVSQRIGTARQ